MGQGAHVSIYSMANPEDESLKWKHPGHSAVIHGKDDWIPADRERTNRQYTRKKHLQGLAKIPGKMQCTRQ
eukprot:540436-Pelagomonas_calceolata.AAC.3